MDLAPGDGAVLPDAPVAKRARLTTEPRPKLLERALPQMITPAATRTTQKIVRGTAVTALLDLAIGNTGRREAG